VALALSLAGVSAEVIATDYAAVSDRMRAHFVELLAATEDPAARDELAEELSSRSATMITVLDHLDAKYGGAEAHLRQGGLGSDAIASLRARLLDRAA